MEKLPLALVTLWHPNGFLNLTLQELAKQVPVITRERITLEQRREQVARSRGLEVWYGYFHGRVIVNDGKSVDTLRKTWISGDMLAWILKDFDVRLIYTREQGSQARYKCEFCPDWGQEPGSWALSRRREIIDGIKLSSRLAIRQLWRNPITAEVLNSSIGEVANLVVGPFDAKDSPREAKLTFEKHDKAWWVVF